MNEILRGLTEHSAATDQHSEDVRLRGRTYTITFDDVWQAAMTVAGGELLGWSVGRSDDQRGVIDALAKTPITGSEADVKIHIGLDRLGQTRVDALATSRKDKGDWGRTRRLIARFFKRLDKQLSAQPGQLIDPTRHPEYQRSA